MSLELIQNFFSEHELVIIWLSAFAIIILQIMIKSEKKELHQENWLTFEELVEDSKKNLWVEELNEQELTYLKSLWSSSNQNIRHEANTKNLILNYQLSLWTITASLLWVITSISYHFSYKTTIEEREKTTYLIIILAFFIICTGMLINNYRNRKNSYTELLSSENLYLFWWSIISPIAFYLCIIWYFK